MYVIRQYMLCDHSLIYFIVVVCYYLVFEFKKFEFLYLSKKTSDAKERPQKIYHDEDIDFYFPNTSCATWKYLKILLLKWTLFIHVGIKIVLEHCFSSVVEMYAI